MHEQPDDPRRSPETDARHDREQRGEKWNPEEEKGSDRAEGRDHPPANPRRDRDGPWLGGG
jgi:hypothetical protein